MAKKHESLFDETKEIIAMLSKDSEQDMVAVVIPSHDNNNQPLAGAAIAEWTDAAMKLFADLFRGATTYECFKGIFKTDEGHYLWDKPLLIETIGDIEAIHKPENLNQIVDFAKRMGKTLKQASVMLVFGTVMYYVEDYSGI